MPQTLEYYANNNSGMSDSFPRNAQGMARDAIDTALAAGVDFRGYDVLGEGMVTALFIIHAGRGAEETGDACDIWSHKWVVPKSPVVAPKLKVSTYLTVPEDCRVGVCAHEWGHLAARWADFYDTGDVQNTTSNGLGDYCLMAAGSWGNNGTTPALPNGMLRMFHSWITPTVLTKSQKGLKLTPAAEGGGCVIIQNKKTMKASQYILVEYRRRKKQDAYLPDDGVAVFVIDESIDDVNDEDRLAIELMQADGKRQLAGIFGTGNAGDAGDLYPSDKNSKLGKGTKPPLNLPNGKWTGVSIKVNGTPGAASMSIDVDIGA
jgi:immune inhibitor A